MKPIVKVILRIFALFFGLKVMILINALINNLGADMGVLVNIGGYVYRYYIFSFVLYMAIGITLWIFNDQIAGIIIRNEDTKINLQINITYNQLMNIALKIFGIILVLISIEPIITEIINIITYHVNMVYSPVKSYYYISLFNPVIKFIVGLVLIFKKEKVAV